jgi:hypothetical protein
MDFVAWLVRGEEEWPTTLSPALSPTLPSARRSLFPAACWPHSSAQFIPVAPLHTGGQCIFLTNMLSPSLCVCMNSIAIMLTSLIVYFSNAFFDGHRGATFDVLLHAIRFLAFAASFVLGCRILLSARQSNPDHSTADDEDPSAYHQWPVPANASASLHESRLWLGTTSGAEHEPPFTLCFNDLHAGVCVCVFVCV